MSLRKSPTSRSCGIRVGITIGDPSGIGPAITAQAINKLEGLADFIVIADKWIFERLPQTAFNVASAGFVDLNNVERKNFSFGKVRAGYGRASIEYLDKALSLIKNKDIDCLVTCPISKEAVNKSGLMFKGHTEYLARKSNCANPVMMLLNDRLRFSLVTRHIQLKLAPLLIKPELLSKTILITREYLKKLFLIKNPRIAVCGLNPHASDNGLMGEEEKDIIIPVLQRLKSKFSGLNGPLSSDVAIAAAYKNEYDCVIAMYHDQALIPLKLHSEYKGVNITLGLPFIRTSPLHGTAFDIAKRPELANPNSLIEAIKLAVKCALNQRKG